MKRTLLTLSMIAAVSTVLNADESKSFIAAINATREAQQILIKDLQDDQSNIRSEYTGCPSAEQFAKNLQDEKRYNDAAKV